MTPEFRPHPRYDAAFAARSRGYDSGFRYPPARGDYWWLGEHEARRLGPAIPYDARYHRFSERTHPRFSPIGGMYPAGSTWRVGGVPRPLRDDSRFSEWTRWF